MCYSDIVRRNLVSKQTEQGISLAQEYGLSLVPGRNLMPEEWPKKTATREATSVSLRHNFVWRGKTQRAFPTAGKSPVFFPQFFLFIRFQNTNYPAGYRIAINHYPAQT